MRKLIYMCVFINPNFLRLLYLLLDSITLWGKLDETTDILIYTSSAFRDEIEVSEWMSPRILFAIDDTKTTINHACEARLDIFDFPIIANYGKILYLDTDILILKEMDNVFRILEDDVLHAVQEGSIDFDCWGHNLFQSNERQRYVNRTAFNSGILLFWNSPAMKRLFSDIKKDIIERAHLYKFMDQPFIVYHAFRNHLYDNQKLKKVAQLRLECTISRKWNIEESKTIIHFLGGVGACGHKEVNMTNCLMTIKTLGRYRMRKS